MLSAYYAFMSLSGIAIVVFMAIFMALFRPPMRGWWLATALYSITGALLLQGARLGIVYGLRLFGVEVALFDRIISGVLAALSAAAAGFFIFGYLRQREWGPGEAHISDEAISPETHQPNKES